MTTKLSNAYMVGLQICPPPLMLICIIQADLETLNKSKTSVSGYRFYAPKLVHDTVKQNLKND